VETEPILSAARPELARPADAPPAERLGVADVRALARDMLARCARAGTPLATLDVRRELEAIDREATFSPGALLEFQQLLARVGVATIREIELPLDDEPFWFRAGQPLAGHRSNATLPASADVVVIGAGLTGASAAYHLAQSLGGRGRVVVLESGDPAGEASGRNGGNYELIPENSVGLYEGLARERLAFLRRCHPSLPYEVLHAESERQASLVLGLALRNRDLLKQIVLRERIDCDLMPRGWLHLTCTEEEEEGVCDEVTLAAQHGQRIELWPRRKIREELGFENGFLGRFIPGDGTYHPFKYTCGLLHCAMRGGVELYTRTPVRALHSDAPDQHRIVTDDGTITTSYVIVATNAFTRELLPELDAIEPYQSQIQVTEHAPDRARGRVVTCDDGPVFFNQPRFSAQGGRAPLLMGGGDDRPMRTPSSRRRSPQVHRTLLALRDRFYPELTGQPPSAEWIGPMAFTPDRLPAIGTLRPGVIIAAGFNGYGGSYTTAAGAAAAHMALTGHAPDWLPEDVFSPRRLLDDAPLFMSEKDGLWRIAASLCRQLHAVNRQISEALTLRTGPVASAVRGRRPPRVSRMLKVGEDAPPTTTHVEPELLATVAAFRHFTPAELEILGPWMQKLELTADTLLFAEGDPGSTCYVVLRGLVDVSVKVRGQPQLLAQLGPGSIFGQMSLIQGEPRSASCSIHKDAVLAQCDAESCERLLSDRSAVALKLFAALNQGLVEALRSADRHLMRLESERNAGSGTMAAAPLGMF
jgi:glycine/D-amino acid oxidase-like deaminating enzyme/CRP-like cAMP-binding protein